MEIAKGSIVFNEDSWELQIQLILFWIMLYYLLEDEENHYLFSDTYRTLPTSTWRRLASTRCRGVSNRFSREKVIFHLSFINSSISSSVCLKDSPRQVGGRSGVRDARSRGLRHRPGGRRCKGLETAAQDIRASSYRARTCSSMKNCDC